MSWQKDMSKEQIQEMRDVFSMFDKDNSGSIDTDELRDVMRELGENPSDKEIQDMIADADKDGSGEIRFAQFMQLMNNQLRAGSEAEIMDAFNAWDKEGRGDIQVKELRSMLMRIPERLQRKDVDKMLAIADPNSKGTIKFSAFVKLLV